MIMSIRKLTDLLFLGFLRFPSSVYIFILVLNSVIFRDFIKRIDLLFFSDTILKPTTSNTLYGFGKLFICFFSPFIIVFQP
jgi:hypothetical protein